MEYYTLEEISQKLKIPVATLRLYLKQEKLKGVKLGKHWRISSEQLDEFIKQGTN